jgi:hypothetical protein
LAKHGITSGGTTWLWQNMELPQVKLPDFGKTCNHLRWNYLILAKHCSYNNWSPFKVTCSVTTPRDAIQMVQWSNAHEAPGVMQMITVNGLLGLLFLL